MSRAAATARHVAILTALGHRKKRHRIPKQYYPKGIEREYATAIKAQLGHARNALTPLMHALPSLLDRARGARRVDTGESEELKRLLEDARRQLDTATAPSAVEALARKFGQQTIRFNRIQLGRQVKAALGVDILTDSPRMQAILSHYVTENASLIKSIPSNVVDQVEGIVQRAFSSGEHANTLADEIEERFKVGESRAQLIARDQVGKLYGMTNATRQRELGIEHFIWRTSGDERVRPEHDDLDGERFAYDDPPSEGMPGEPIQCRCTAEPDFDSILTAEDDSET